MVLKAVTISASFQHSKYHHGYIRDAEILVRLLMTLTNHYWLLWISVRILGRL